MVTASALPAHFLPERRERQHRELDVLDGEGDANDRDREPRRHDDVAEEDPDPGYEDPQDVEEHPERTCRKATARADEILAEREQAEPRDLEALHPERDSNHRQAQEQPADHVLDEDDDATPEDGPQQVQDQGHRHLRISVRQRHVPLGAHCR